MQNIPILILTGDTRSGKTTFLQQWVKERKDIAGWLSPVVDGERFFYNIPEQVVYNMEVSVAEKDILEVGKFIFSATVFLKASEKLIAWSNEKKWKYIIIDEIGPLELGRQQGLFDALDEVVKKQDASFKLILVVRKSLLQKAIEFCQRYNRQVKAIQITEAKESMRQE